jgi:hypothetical protein
MEVAVAVADAVTKVGMTVFVCELLVALPAAVNISSSMYNYN